MIDTSRSVWATSVPYRGWPVIDTSRSERMGLLAYLSGESGDLIFPCSFRIGNRHFFLVWNLDIRN